MMAPGGAYGRLGGFGGGLGFMPGGCLAYGYGATPTGNDAVDYAWLQPVAAGVVGPSTTTEAAVLRAQLADAIVRGADGAKIMLLQAQLQAAELRDASQWQWSLLGKVGAVVAIALLASQIRRRG